MSITNLYVFVGPAAVDLYEERVYWHGMVRVEGLGRGRICWHGRERDGFGGPDLERNSDLYCFELWRFLLGFHHHLIVTQEFSSLYSYSNL